MLITFGAFEAWRESKKRKVRCKKNEINPFFRELSQICAEQIVFLVEIIIAKNKEAFDTKQSTYKFQVTT